MPFSKIWICSFCPLLEKGCWHIALGKQNASFPDVCSHASFLLNKNSQTPKDVWTDAFPRSGTCRIWDQYSSNCLERNGGRGGVREKSGTVGSALVNAIKTEQAPDWLCGMLTKRRASFYDLNLIVARRWVVPFSDPLRSDSLKWTRETEKSWHCCLGKRKTKQGRGRRDWAIPSNSFFSKQILEQIEACLMQQIPKRQTTQYRYSKETFDQSHPMQKQDRVGILDFYLCLFWNSHVHWEHGEAVRTLD